MLPKLLHHQLTTTHIYGHYTVRKGQDSFSEWACLEYILLFRSPYCVWSFVFIFMFAMMMYTVLYLGVSSVFTFYWFTSGQMMCMYKVLLLMKIMIYDLVVRMEPCHKSGKISVWEKRKNLMLLSWPKLAHLTSASLLVSCPFCLKRMYKFSLNLCLVLIHILEKLLTLIHAFQQIRQTYRVSQEECARLRESVPYVKVYWYNPKHLYPKFNGYGDNGLRKVVASCGSKYCNLHSWCLARQRWWPWEWNAVLIMPAWQLVACTGVGSAM